MNSRQITDFWGGGSNKLGGGGILNNIGNAFDQATRLNGGVRDGGKNLAEHTWEIFMNV